MANVPRGGGVDCDSTFNEGFSSVLAFQPMVLETEYLLAYQKIHNR